MTQHPLKSKSDLKRMIKALVYSCHGLKSAWKNETAFRYEIIMTLVLLPLTPWLGQSWVERTILCGSLFLLIVAELINSAIESAVDYISKEIHPLAKQAKDMASAAVFVCLILSFSIWLSALYNYFFT